MLTHVVLNWVELSRAKSAKSEERNFVESVSVNAQTRPFKTVNGFANTLQFKRLYEGEYRSLLVIHAMQS